MCVCVCVFVCVCVYVCVCVFLCVCILTWTADVHEPQSVGAAADPTIPVPDRLVHTAVTEPVASASKAAAWVNCLRFPCKE